MSSSWYSVIHAQKLAVATNASHMQLCVAGIARSLRHAHATAASAGPPAAAHATVATTAPRAHHVMAFSAREGGGLPKGAALHIV